MRDFEMTSKAILSVQIRNHPSSHPTTSVVAVAARLHGGPTRARVCYPHHFYVDVSTTSPVASPAENMISARKKITAYSGPKFGSEGFWCASGASVVRELNASRTATWLQAIHYLYFQAHVGGPVAPCLWAPETCRPPDRLICKIHPPAVPKTKSCFGSDVLQALLAPGVTLTRVDVSGFITFSWLVQSLDGSETPSKEAEDRRCLEDSARYCERVL